MTVDLTLIAAFVVGSLAIGRVTRLVVDDDFPPVMWLRGWYIRTAPEAWAELVGCAFCISFWIALANTTWAYLSDLHWTWWFANLTFASAYVGAMVNRRDVPVS